jgi:hypothetical protein
VPLEERLIHDGFVCAHVTSLLLVFPFSEGGCSYRVPAHLVVTGWVHVGAEVVTRKGCANVDCLSRIGAPSQRFSNLANRPPENQYWFLPGRLRIMLHFATSEDDSVVAPIMGSKTRAEGSSSGNLALLPSAYIRLTAVRILLGGRA